VQLERLWLTDFRNYEHAELVPAPDGLTVVTGANGEGKTNLLEAVGYLATLRSFRGAPAEALVRAGSDSAVVRAEGRRERRNLLIEAEVRPAGRDRVRLNRQPLRRSRDLLGALQVTVFAPDDLDIVKGGPAGRRRYLDDLLVSLHPRHDAAQAEVERVLRQRNALLKSVAGRGRPGPEVTRTLDVWDAKLADAGEALAAARRGLAAALEPRVAASYRRLAEAAGLGGRSSIRLAYQASWEGPLAAALARARDDDLRRALTTVGPHRDELGLWVRDLPARTHASQGEARSLALGLRLGGHQLVGERIASSPILLLDDVFSELDAHRSAALLDGLPDGQALLTTAGALPAGARPAAVVRVDDGKLLA
jgi:DNA replication and repair protein RecF